MKRDPSVAPPARIHLLTAKAAPTVVVIRRKPSRLFHVLRWNTATDEIEPGSWFRGRLYEMRCDLSFDGQWMTYLAMGNRGETWSGICRPPFLRTFVHWENTGTWNGGGVFRSPDLLEANAGYSEGEMEKALKEMPKKLTFKVRAMENWSYGEDEGVLYPRFERDGFQRAGPMGREVRVPNEIFAFVCENDPGWLIAPSKEHPELRVRYRGYWSGRGRVFEFDLPDYPELLDKEVTWAAYDSLGQLIAAKNGVLYRYSLAAIQSGRPDKVIDLEPLSPPEVSVRPDVEDFDEPAPIPPVRIVEGALEDQPVKALVIPTSKTPWAERVRELAGEMLLKTSRDQHRTAFLSPAFFLRQHDLIHVKEPLPAEGESRLKEVCREAFAVAAEGTGTSVALHPIGLASGFDRDVALKATQEAADEYVSHGGGREVLIVKPGTDPTQVG